MIGRANSGGAAQIVLLTLIAGTVTAVATGGALAQPLHTASFTPLAEEFGIGYIQLTDPPAYDPGYFKYDSPDVLLVGSDRIEMYYFAYRAWAVFDISWLPGNIEVVSASITNTVIANEGVEQVFFRRVEIDLLTANAEDAWVGLEELTYSNALMQGVEGELETALGDSACSDIEATLESSGRFTVGMTAIDVPWEGAYSAMLQGRNAGQPQLTVVYREAGTAAEPTTWGEVKARHR